MKQISIGSGKTLWFVDRDGSAYWQYQSRLEEANQQITNRGYRYIQVGGKRYLKKRLKTRTLKRTGTVPAAAGNGPAASLRPV